MTRARAAKGRASALGAVAALVSALGCGEPFTSADPQAATSTGAGGAGGAPASTGTGSTAQATGTSSSDASAVSAGGGTSVSTGAGADCAGGTTIDNDLDGFSEAQGDCDDCSFEQGPGAMELGGNGLDDDCNGTIDDVPLPCDAPLMLASADPYDAARAMGLCQIVGSVQQWGVLKAEYELPDGAPLGVDPKAALGHGILGNFGPNVHAQEGAMLLALSSGAARRPGDPGQASVTGFDKAYACNAPVGYPKPWAGCNPSIIPQDPRDGIALELRLIAPTNVRSMRFDFDFYASDFPTYVCDAFNDFFVAMLSPSAPGVLDGNLAFDSLGTPMGVNVEPDMLRVCVSQLANGVAYPCALGATELMGTGFDIQTTGAATSWLRTVAPVEPGSTITLSFSIWDSGDGALDSTVLIDNFAFDVGEIEEVKTTRVESPL